MKKIVIVFSAFAILALAAFLVYQFRPEKRYANHVAKARMYTKESNYTSALKEYEKAYSTRGGFTPYSSVETLKLTNLINLQKGDEKSALANSKQFVRNFPTNKEGKLVLAELAFRAGDVESAVEALTALLAMDPKNIQARMLMASLRMKQRRLDLAEDELRVIYEENPDSVAMVVPLARSLLEQGKLDESRALLRKVLARHPKDTASNQLLTDSYLREGMPDSARASLERWQTADPAVLIPATLRKARLLTLVGKSDSAAALLSAYQTLTKENAPVLGEIAKMRVKRGHIDSAVALYGTLKEMKFMPAGQSDFMVTLLHLADHQPARGLEALKRMQIAGRNESLNAFEIATLVAMEQPQKVDALIASAPDSLHKPLREFQQQLKPDMEFIGGWALANYYQTAGESFMVLRVTDSLYKRWPDNPMLIRSYSRLLGQLRHYKKAADVLGKLKSAGGADRMTLVELRIKSGEHKAALDMAQVLAGQDPGFKGIHVVQAELHRVLGNRPKMLESYEKELAADPGNLVAVNNLAWEYGVVDKDLAKAEPYLKTLEASKNNDPRILDTIGWILALNGKLPESARYFDLALILLPDNPSILYHKGWLLHKQGKTAEGQALIKQALESPWPFGEKEDAKKLLAGST